MDGYFTYPQWRIEEKKTDLRNYMEESLGLSVQETKELTTILLDLIDLMISHSLDLEFGREED